MPVIDVRSQARRRSPEELVKCLKPFPLDLKFSALFPRPALAEHVADRSRKSYLIGERPNPEAVA